MPTTQITAEDYVAAQKLHSELTWRQAIVFSAMLLLALAAFIWAPRREWYYALVMGGLGGGAVGALVARLILRVFVLPARARRVYRQQKSLHGDIEYEWDDEAFSVRTERAQARTPWRDFAKWRENDRLFLLYHSDVIFNMVPKRLFADATQLQAFRSRLATSVGAA